MFDLRLLKIPLDSLSKKQTARQECADPREGTVGRGHDGLITSAASKTCLSSAYAGTPNDDSVQLREGRLRCLLKHFVLGTWRVSGSPPIPV